jgi:hypothetical protein
MFVCVQLATMPDHACVVERRFFANDSLLKCRRSSSSHGCFARLSMHRVFSTELSIALTDAEDFFKCIQAAVSWEIDRSIERERESSFLERLCSFSNTYGGHLLSSRGFSNTHAEKIFGRLLQLPSVTTVQNAARIRRSAKIWELGS